MASLPPISAMTRLIQIWPGWVLAASSLMRRPTSREPVKAMKRVLGCWTMTSPTAAPLPVRSVKEDWGKPASRSEEHTSELQSLTLHDACPSSGAGEGDEAGLGVLDDDVTDGRAAAGEEREGRLGEAGFEKHFGELGGDGGSFAGGFDDGGVAGDERGDGHADEDGEREIPWRNDDADAERDVDHFVVLAGELDDGLRRGETVHIARVVLAEIDGFGDVRVGFGPGFAGFVDQPGVELKLAEAQNAGGLEGHEDALGGGSGGPLREGGVGGINGAIGERGGRAVMDADDFGGIGRIDGRELIAGGDGLMADAQGIFAAEFGAHLFEGRFHGLPVGGLGEIGDGFVAELGKSSGCHSLL